MRLKKGVTVKHLGNDTILYDEENQNVNMAEVAVLNASATYLIESTLGKEFSEVSWTDLLVERYGITREAAQEDVIRWILKLRANGYLEE